jgi:phosphoribosylglycinamide formyltransferase-1
MAKPLSLVVLVSGDGSNLQAIIEAVQSGMIKATIAAVISNNAAAYGLERARLAGIPAIALVHTDYKSRDDFDQALQQTIDEYAPDLVVLAGFMRLLGDDFVNHYTGRMLNIHPSLLPKYRGLNTHQRALDAGESQQGATVHFVTPALDSGPLILQVSVAVNNNDNAMTLAARVLKQEHLIYPLVIGWFVEQRLRLEQGQVLFDDNVLTQPIAYVSNEKAL